MLGQSRHVRCTFIKPIDGILFTRVLVFTLPMATNISVDDLSMLCKKKRHCISPCTDPIPCVRFYLWNPVSLTLKKIYKSQTKIQLVMVSCFFFLLFRYDLKSCKLSTVAVSAFMILFLAITHINFWTHFQALSKENNLEPRKFPKKKKHTN